MARPAGVFALVTVLAGGPGAALAGHRAAAATAAAPPAGGADLQVVGACPAEAAVRELLAPLLPPGRGPGGVVSIQDQGPHYRIALPSGAMTFDDPARDCADRARQAAAYVADERRAHERVLGPPQWTIEKGVVFDFSSSSNNMVWAPGAEFRGAFGPGRWSLVGSAGARGPVTLSFQGGWQADLLRFPLDVGARMTMYRWRFRPWFVVGGSLTVTGILGREVVESDRVWRVDPGALLMAGATLRVRKRIGVAAALNVRWQPRPHELHVVPVGKVGETPVWWIGVSLNYTIDGEPSNP